MLKMDNRKEEVFEEKKDDLSYLKDERKHTLKETLKELAESSSLHGIPKIVSSRQIVVKVLWSILVLAAFAVVSFQLYLLFKTYYSYPSQTSVSLDFSPIAFPAITLCNLNPVRKSQLHRSEDLRDLLSEDQVYARRKRGTEGTNSENKHLLDAEGKAMFKVLTRNLNDETIKKNKHAEGKGNNITDDRRENKPKVTFQKSTFSDLNRDKRLKLNNHKQLENTRTVRHNGEGLRNRREADTTTKETEAASYSVTKANSDSVTQDAVTKANSDSVTQDAVTKANSDSVTKDAVTKANSDSVTKDAVTKANSDSVTKDAVTKANSDSVTQDAVTKANSDSVTKDAVTKANSDSVTQDAVTKANSDSVTQDAVTKANSDSVTKDAVTKANSDSVTKDAVTKANSDSVTKDAVTKANSDSVTQDAVTKANSDSVTKDAVTKANSDSVTQDAVTKANSDSVTQDAVTKANSDSVTQDAVTKANSDSVTKDAVTKANSDSVTKDAVTKANSDSVTQDAVTKANSDSVTQDAVTKANSDSVTQDAVTKANSDSVTQDAVTDANSDSVTQDAVTKANSDSVTQDAVTKANSDSVTKDAVTKANSDSVTKDAVTKANSDSVTKDAVTKAISDSVTKDAVTKANSDSVTKDAVTKANSDSVTNNTVTKANSDSVTKDGISDELSSSTINYDYFWFDYSDLNEDFYWDDWLSDNFDERLYLKQLGQTKDEWDARVENFKKAIKIKPLHLRRKMGHQIEDMVQNVTFAGRVQKVRQSKTFSKNFTSVEYGNCYTMANRKFVALRSGPSNAMKLTLNVEIDEYIDNLSTGYGIRIVFHEHGTYPLPSHEGITLSPGSETNIGLRMVRISRLPEPHGNCSDGREFARKYQKKYSISACYEFCRILEIIETCNCLPAEAPDEVPLNKTSLPVCNTAKEAVEKCILEVNMDLDNGNISCDCHAPCRETVFTKTTSSTFWPSDDYLKVLITEVCNNKSYSDFWKAPCSDMENLASHELDKYRRNFLRVLIYYEDLNYELIEEEPLYEPVRFLSDIGGTMGLFLGASALTFVEILQLVLELILFIKHKN